MGYEVFADAALGLSGVDGVLNRSICHQRKPDEVAALFQGARRGRDFPAVPPTTTLQAAAKIAATPKRYVNYVSLRCDRVQCIERPLMWQPRLGISCVPSHRILPIGVGFRYPRWQDSRGGGSVGGRRSVGSVLVNQNCRSYRSAE